MMHHLLVLEQKNTNLLILIKDTLVSFFSYYIVLSMNILKMILIGYGLSADAFAASIVASLESNKSLKTTFMCSTIFGLFQGIMPLLGYLLSMNFSRYISAVDHYIAFILLTVIGLNMIKERNKEEIESNYDFKTILILGIATSIDAFAVGTTIGVMGLPVLLSCSMIAVITFVMCLIASFIGIFIGNHHAASSKLIGGIILIIIGIHTLIEHLML